MKKVHEKRLRRLAKLLCEQAELERQMDESAVNFDLLGWGYSMESLGRNCNTQACAVGLACLTPEFQKEGLTSSKCYEIIPQFKGKSSWEAVMAFFGLTYYEALQLFSTTRYSGPTKGPDGAMAVSERITRFVETGKMYE